MTNAAINSRSTSLTNPCTYRWISRVNGNVLGHKICVSSAVSRNFVRHLSNAGSEKKKDSSVFSEMMEAKEQPQTQLTVGAKGMQ